MQENNEEEKIEETTDVESKPVDYNKLSKEQIMEVLKGAVAGGHIAQKDVQRLRQEMGILNSAFTKRTISDTKRKSKRIAQKQARRKQRK